MAANPVVQKQISERLEQVIRLTSEANNMMLCEHTLKEPELQNTFHPKEKLRCQTCRAWLE